MATVAFSAGERFSCKISNTNGYGVVLPDGSSFVIFGDGGRSGYQANKKDIPPDAIPLRLIPPHEVTFALDCVLLSHGSYPTTFVAIG